MAIRIPILTSFDPKGLKAANASFANLSNQVSSLGRNFAVAGAAAVGIGAFLGKAVGSASDLQESVNAVNVAFGSSAAGILKFGETAATSLGTSQVAFNQAAVRFSAFADRIVGQGGDVAGFIGDISVRASDFASVFNIEVSEALGVFQSGLAGEAEPLKRFGINLLDNEVKAYAAANSIGEVGRQLTETEKVQARYGLLMQETSKTSGDFANTSGGLANSMRIMKATIADTQAEIGQQLLPVLEEIIPVVREMVSEFGDKLLVAVKAVDWKTLLTQVAGVTQFLITNIETITRVIAAFWALSTIVKTVTLVLALGKVAADLYAWGMANLTTKTAIATVATNLFSAAMRLIPIVAVAAGLWAIADGFNRTKLSIEQTLPGLGLFETNTIAAADSASRLIPAGGVFRIFALQVLEATGALERFNQARAGATKTSSSTNPTLRAADEALIRRHGERLRAPVLPPMPDFSQLGAGAAAALAAIPALDTSAIDGLVAAQQQAANQEQSILNERLSAFQSFNSAVKTLFGQIKDSIMSSFELPKLGSSVNSITRNIAKLLERTKKFASSISQLSGMGLNSALLQQVIQAGPMAGSQLAAALVSGGSAFVGQLNQAYSEFGSVASAIAGTGTGAAFNNPTVENTYNIEVNGGVGSGPSIGKAIVDAIKSYERTSGAVWQGA
jgi:hypothetical protein